MTEDTRDPLGATMLQVAAADTRGFQIYRCFHCKEAFSGVDAENHFGKVDGAEPACLIKVAGEFALLRALRNAEESLDRHRADDSDTIRAMWSMQSDHALALRREEEKGYARGVKDRTHEFKNFHRLLCERFNYAHDELDWQRDQLSLIEWIAKRSELDDLRAEIARLNALINTPHTHDFIEAVKLEMPHQRERWGSEHDGGKTPADWLWLVAHLATKALTAIVSGNTEKGKHHVITTAAALGNWFLAITGESTAMRPGIEGPSDQKGRLE